MYAQFKPSDAPNGVEMAELCGKNYYFRNSKDLHVRVNPNVTKRVTHLAFRRGNYLAGPRKIPRIVPNVAPHFGGG